MGDVLLLVGDEAGVAETVGTPFGVIEELASGVGVVPHAARISTTARTGPLINWLERIFDAQVTHSETDLLGFASGRDFPGHITPGLTLRLPLS